MDKYISPTLIFKCVVIPPLCTIRENSDFLCSGLCTTVTIMGRSTGQR